MGFFDNLVSGIKTTVSNIVKSVKVTSKISQIQTIAPNISLKSGVVGTAVAGTVAAAALNPTATATVVKTISAKPLQSIAIAAAVPVVVSAVSSSKTLQSAIVNTPQSLTNFGSNIGGLVDNPSLESAQKIIKENPILTTATIGAVAIGSAVGATGLVSNYLTAANTKAMVKNTAEMAKEAETYITNPTGVTSGLDISKTSVITPGIIDSGSEVMGSVPVKKVTKKKPVKKKKKAVKKKKKPVKKKKKPVKKKKKKKKYK
jgi:hypothetical protein